eukprot:scaffold638_cov168-Amphora_coffeaeformis.AAC.42
MSIFNDTDTSYRTPYEPVSHPSHLSAVVLRERARLFLCARLSDGLPRDWELPNWDLARWTGSTRVVRWA